MGHKFSYKDIEELTQWSSEFISMAVKNNNWRDAQTVIDGIASVLNVSQAFLEETESDNWLINKLQAVFYGAEAIVHGFSNLSREDAEQDVIYNLKLITQALNKRRDSERLAETEDTYNGLPLFYLTTKGLHAKGVPFGKQFILLKGSQVSVSTADSCQPSAMAKREELIASGIISRKGDAYVLKKDCLVDSHSTAAGIIVGYSFSGPECWKTKDGRFVKAMW